MGSRVWGLLEAARLHDDLRRRQAEPYDGVINSSLAATTTTDTLLRARAAVEREMIRDVRDRRAAREFVVPWLAEPPVGHPSPHEWIGAASKRFRWMRWEPAQHLSKHGAWGEAIAKGDRAEFNPLQGARVD